MNILFFMKPKGEVSYLYDDFSMRQGLEKLERSGYTAIPVINRQGEYIGTITEGDFLWSLKNKFALDLKQAEEVPLTIVKRDVYKRQPHDRRPESSRWFCRPDGTLPGGSALRPAAGGR